MIIHYHRKFWRVWTRTSGVPACIRTHWLHCNASEAWSSWWVFRKGAVQQGLLEMHRVPIDPLGICRSLTPVLLVAVYLSNLSRWYLRSILVYIYSYIQTPYLIVVRDSIFGVGVMICCGCLYIRNKHSFSHSFSQALLFLEPLFALHN